MSITLDQFQRQFYCLIATYQVIRVMELRSLPLEIKTDDDVPKVGIQVDCERLLQAFLNILENAINY